jgi:hypothetical protein
MKVTALQVFLQCHQAEDLNKENIVADDLNLPKS